MKDIKRQPIVQTTVAMLAVVLSFIVVWCNLEAKQQSLSNAMQTVAPIWAIIIAIYVPVLQRTFDKLGEVEGLTNMKNAFIEETWSIARAAHAESARGDALQKFVEEVAEHRFHAKIHRPIWDAIRPRLYELPPSVRTAVRERERTFAGVIHEFQRDFEAPSKDAKKYLNWQGTIKIMALAYIARLNNRDVPEKDTLSTNDYVIALAKLEEKNL